MPSQQPAASFDARTHFVYRLFDSDTLLYVGVAVDPGARLYIHSREKAWWPEVSRTALSSFPTREDAEYREAHAILTEHPRYNVAIPSLARFDKLKERTTQDGPALTAEARIGILEAQLRTMARRARRAETEAAKLYPLAARLHEAETRLAALSPETFQRRITRAEVALDLAHRQRHDERRAWLVEVHRLEDLLRASRRTPGP